MNFHIEYLSKQYILQCDTTFMHPPKCFETLPLYWHRWLNGNIYNSLYMASFQLGSGTTTEWETQSKLASKHTRVEKIKHPHVLSSLTPCFWNNCEKPPSRDLELHGAAPPYRQGTCLVQQFCRRHYRTRPLSRKEEISIKLDSHVKQEVLGVAGGSAMHRRCVLTYTLEIRKNKYFL